MPTDDRAMQQLLWALDELTNQLRGWTVQLNDVLNVFEQLPDPVLADKGDEDNAAR